MAPWGLAGRTVLVTGATDGLGRALCAALVDAGADVLVHGRSPSRLDDTLAELTRRGGAGALRGYRADLASLEGVAALVTELRACEPRLDALVSNAGLGAREPGGGRRMESADGHELRFAVNYLAGYGLITELLGLLRKSAPARIVLVASAGQQAIDFDDVMLERGYSGRRAYCQSKLAQILQCVDLAERLEGSGVTATCLHPATYMPTKIVDAPLSTIEEGVRATLRLLADPALAGVSGVYFDGERRAEPHPQARDGEARRRLAALSEHLWAPFAG